MSELIINRKELLNKLQMVAVGLADKESVPQSLCFAFDNGRIFTFRGDVGVCTPFPQGDALKCAVPGQMLLALLRKMSSDEVSLELAEGQLHVKGGRVKAKLLVNADVTLPFDEYIQPPTKLEKLPYTPKQFSEGVKTVTFSICNDTQTMQLYGVHIGSDSEGTFIESTDRTRMTRRYISDKVCEINLKIIADYIKSLVSIEPVEYAHHKGFCYFKCKDGTIYACTVPEKDFPDLKKTLTECEKVEMVNVTFPASVESILDIANDFAVDAMAVDGRLLVTVEEGKAKFYVKGDHGEFSERCKVKHSGDIKFSFHPKKLQEVLQMGLRTKISERVIVVSGEVDKLPFWHVSVLNKMF